MSGVCIGRAPKLFTSAKSGRSAYALVMNKGQFASDRKLQEAFRVHSLR